MEIIYTSNFLTGSDLWWGNALTFNVTNVNAPISAGWLGGPQRAFADIYRETKSGVYSGQTYQITCEIDIPSGSPIQFLAIHDQHGFASNSLLVAGNEFLAPVSGGVINYISGSYVCSNVSLGMPRIDASDASGNYSPVNGLTGISLYMKNVVISLMSGQ